MKIPLVRPDDLVLARLYDEAKQAVMERSTPSSDRCLLAAAFADQLADADCCVGDRSRCRCVPPTDEEREQWIATWRDSE